MATVPVEAKVIGKDGTVSTGYIINGATFKDAAGTQRIDSGSTVQTNDGRSWVYNAQTGGAATPQTITNEYKKSLDYSGFDNALSTMQSGINSRASAQQAAYNRQADKIRRDAEIAKKEAKEAYIQASAPYGPIGQRLEALGLGDSGYAETTYARLGNQYQKLLSDQARATEDALAGIYGDIEAAYAQADYDRAMAAANMMLQRDSAMRGDNQFITNLEMNGYQTVADQNRYDEQRQDQLDRYAVEDARYDAQTVYQQKQDALAYILSGYITPDIAAAAGMTEAEATARYRQYLAAQPVTTRSSGSGGGSGKKKTSGSDEPITEGLLERYNELKQYVDDGSFEEKDLYDALKTEFKYDSAIDVKAAINKLQKARTQTANANSAESEVYGSEYSTIWNNVRRMSDRGKTSDQILDYLDSKKKGITDAGLEKIMRSIGLMG